MSSLPTLKTYEEFLEHMSKENEIVKRRFFDQIMFAQREAERLRAKNRRRYYRQKAARDAAKEAAQQQQQATESDE